MERINFKHNPTGNLPIAQPLKAALNLKKQERFKKIEMLCRKYGTLHLMAECDWIFSVVV